jgi:ribosomal protein S18 acetylase RimI-like enzyme
MASEGRPIPSLVAELIALNGPSYEEILQWPFPDEPFFVRQVRALLAADIPQRVRDEGCAIYGYRDAADGNALVGFGTISISRLYAEYLRGRSHPYIPLLAVHPEKNGRGYGRFIVEHLVSEAARHAAGQSMASRVFLDVYTANTPAIGLYAKCGFSIVNPDHPIADPAENQATYVIMSRTV